MRNIGLEFRHDQLRIMENADLSKTRGDVSLTEDPRDVVDTSVAKRCAEFEDVRQKFSGSPLFGRIERVNGLFTRYQVRGVLASNDVDRVALAGFLREILRE
ncbi:MAG: hypothetical protein ACREYF_22275 [Gammaproteobacteria bacterium]